MIFSHPLRTRGTECGPDRWITLPAVISYMEHSRWEFLRVPELGLVDAIHDGFGFFVLNQQIAMSRRFGQGVPTTSRIALTYVGRSEARGIQDVVRDDGVLLAHCRIRGVWMGPNGRMARIPRVAREVAADVEFALNRGVDEPGDPDSYFDPPAPLRDGGLELRVDDEIPGTAHVRPLRVRATDCDLFRHVNAAGYVRYIADSLAVQGASPSLHRADLKYVGQALSGDAVEVHTWRLDGERWGGAVVRGDEVLFRSVVETEATP